MASDHEILKSLNQDLVNINKSIEESLAMFNKLGNFWRYLDRDEALFYYTMSRDASLRVNDEGRYAATLNNIGIIYMKQGLLDDAISAFEEAEQVRGIIKDDNGRARSLHYLSICYGKKGDLEKVVHSINKIKIIRSAQPLYPDNSELKSDYEKRKKQNDLQGIAGVLCDLGMMSERDRNYDDAENYYRKCLEIHSSPKSCDALMWNRLGEIFYNKEDYQQAKNYFENSLTLCEDFLWGRDPDPNHELSLTAEHCTLVKGDLDDREFIGIRAWIQHSNQRLGQIALGQGDYRKAKIYFNKNLERDKYRRDNESIAIDLYYLGETSRREGDRYDAHNYFIKSLEEDPDSRLSNEIKLKLSDLDE